MEPSFLKKARPVATSTTSFMDKVRPVAQPAPDRSFAAAIEAEDARTAALPWYRQGENIASGVSKGAISTVKGLGTVGTSALNLATTGIGKVGQLFGAPMPNTEQGIPQFRTGTPEEQRLRSALTPRGAAQNIGYGAEKIIEATMPVGQAGGLPGAMGKVDTAIKSAPILQAAQGASLPVRAGYGLARTALRTAAEAAPQFGLGYIQSGGDVEAAKTQAAVGGAIKGATGLAGELISGTSATLRPYVNIFGKGLKPKEALEQAKIARAKGLVGSADEMSDKIADGLAKSEANVIDAARKSNVAVKVGTNPQRTGQELEKIGDFLSDFEGADNQKLAESAYELAIKSKSGTFNMEDAIAARKLFDRMVYYSENGNVPKSGQIYKSFADFLREQINKAPIVGEAMDDYRFYTRAARPVLNVVRREASTPALSKLEMLYLGGMALSGQPEAAIPIAAGKLSSLPKYSTRIAQLFERGMKNPALPTLGAGTFGQMMGRDTTQQ